MTVDVPPLLGTSHQGETGRALATVPVDMHLSTGCISMRTRSFSLRQENDDQNTYEKGRGFPQKEITMDNQHRQIKGYRELDQSEIDLMNEIKFHGEQLAGLISQLRPRAAVAGVPINGSPDQRWVSIGETHLQQGIMALVRAVAQPESF